MKYMNCLICMLMIFAGWGCSDDTIQENKEPMVATDGGYLFAHMTDENYARLFYSVSRDAFHWETLNKKRIVLPDYCGHPDICQGKDGVFYMIGVQPNTGIPILWSSSDLVIWKSDKLKKVYI